MPFTDPEKKRAYGKLWYEANKARKAETDRLRYIRNNSSCEGQEANRARAKRDYRKHRAKRLLQKRHQYSIIKDVILTRAKKCRARNAESYRASTRRYAEKTKYWRKPNHKERRARYYESHRATLIAREQELKRLNPGKYYASRSARWHKRRAILAGLSEHFTKKQWDALKRMYGHRCLRCDKAEPDIRLSADHVVPLCVGGVNTIDNIQPLCVRCNCIKARTSTDYRPAAITLPASLRCLDAHRQTIQGQQMNSE